MNVTTECWIFKESIQHAYWCTYYVWNVCTVLICKFFIMYIVYMCKKVNFGPQIVDIIFLCTQQGQISQSCHTYLLWDHNVIHKSLITWVKIFLCIDVSDLSRTVPVVFPGVQGWQIHKKFSTLSPQLLFYVPLDLPF